MANIAYSVLESGPLRSLKVLLLLHYKGSLQLVNDVN